MPHPRSFQDRTEISGSPADDCDILSTAGTYNYAEPNPCAGFVVLADAVLQFKTSGDPSGLKASVSPKAGAVIAVKITQIVLTSGTIMVHKYSPSGVGT